MMLICQTLAAKIYGDLMVLQTEVVDYLALLKLRNFNCQYASEGQYASPYAAGFRHAF